jgi:hypothetical protein
MTASPYEYAFRNEGWVEEKDADPATARMVSAWAATPKVLARLAAFPQLEGLLVGDGGRKNQPGVAALRRLKVLRLGHIVGDDLGFLGDLAELRILELSSVVTRSLRGLEKLRKLECLVAGLLRLERITLRGVRPASGGLRPLDGLKALAEVEISHVPSFTLEDFARLAGALPNASGDCVRPHFRMGFPWPCKRCQTTQEWLTGVVGRQKRFLCPVCEKDKLAAHVAEFERIRKAARAAV